MGFVRVEHPPACAWGLVLNNGIELHYPPACAWGLVLNNGIELHHPPACAWGGCTGLTDPAAGGRREW